MLSAFCKKGTLLPRRIDFIVKCNLSDCRDAMLPPIC